MGKHTPTMNDQERKVYLEAHLKNELEWLLRAATEWHVQNKIRLPIDGYYARVYAMDSAFLHARSLFEFFTKRANDNYYGCDTYKLATISSDLYTNDWAAPLHAYLMHVQERPKQPQLLCFDRSKRKKLNKMPVDFAKEIMRIWREFERRLGRASDPEIKSLQQVAERIRKDAETDAAKVLTNEMVRRFNVKPIVW